MELKKFFSHPIIATLYSFFINNLLISIAYGATAGLMMTIYTFIKQFLHTGNGITGHNNTSLITTVKIFENIKNNCMFFLIFGIGVIFMAGFLTSKKKFYPIKLEWYHYLIAIYIIIANVYYLINNLVLLYNNFTCLNQISVINSIIQWIVLGYLSYKHWTETPNSLDNL